MGARLGIMMIKMGLCTLLHNFDFKAVDQKLSFQPTNLLLTDENHIRLKISKREGKDE